MARTKDSLSAADVRLGMSVAYGALDDWLVWSQGPDPSTWWLIRYDSEGKSHSVVAKTAELRRTKTHRGVK